MDVVTDEVKQVVNIKKISIVAGLFNILGVLIFSLGFTNPYLAKFSPNIFSSFGLLLIMLWGLAYIVAGYGEVNAGLYGVFALEKALYFLTWWGWMMEHAYQLGYVYHQSAMAGIFYALYGPIDLLFGVYFFSVMLKYWHAAPSTR